ncbi:MAG: M56 family metallopeptidase [Bacteroidota bacterium]
MLEYLLKSTACMALLLLFYKLLLEKESIHVYKRFFLIGSILVSLIIPVLVFTEYIEMVSTVVQTQINRQVQQGMTPSGQPITDMDVIHWKKLWSTLYPIGVLIFGLRFSKHFYQILRRIKKNPKIKANFTTLVLLQEKLPPHTFFNYVFLNKDEFERKVVPNEVLVHEETHARQYHSLDVLFIEVLQVLLWFNPLLYLFKKSIKLNHEFLADSAVLKEKVNTQKYQNTLLSYLSVGSEKKYQPIYMANAINYSSIKKRFIIMKTKTSKKSFVLRTLLLLPMLAFLLFAFSEKRTVETDTPPTKTWSVQHRGKKQFILRIDNSQIFLNGNNVAIASFAQAVDDMTADWKKVDYASIPCRANFSSTPASFLIKVEIEFKKTLFSKSNEGMTIFPKGYEKIIVQSSASREQMKEYNALAKKYNEMPKDHIRILQKEVERMTYIYNIMSDKQRKDAEPFPNLPEPPSPPKAPKPSKKVSDHEYASNQIETIIEKQDPYDVVKSGGIYASLPPPPPPAPKTPLEHIKEVAEKGAIFYLNNERISAEKAIALFEGNEALNIVTEHATDSDYVVHISTEPIRTKE